MRHVLTGDEKCKDCAYYAMINEKVGECRVNPPARDGKGSEAFPLIGHDKWCGLFQPSQR